ncbi:TPA: hypothetical protein DDZ86_00165 [Candidatus Dependentiae bacterium]|nr:MAG: sodium/alanine symporter [candidate division TM6 bacterium GW2011_GWF2_43_87]HBL98042.1 hypothetical protein [Candidatus Dependentiae bacterium]
MIINTVTDYLWGWPMPVFLSIAGLIITFAFRFVQIRYFFTSWRYVLSPKGSAQGEEISPIQAFLSTLSSTLGNGSLVGMAVAMYAGGPGGAIWLMIFGLFAMPIRFAEVLASSIFTTKTEHGMRGGPMVYLAKVPGGSALTYLYAFTCLLFTFVGSGLMQCNSMTGGLTALTGVDARIIAVIMLIFVVYILLGGSKRIVRFSEVIAPLKVLLFILATGSVIVMFLPNLFSALKLMVDGAFSSQALVGGLAGHMMQNAIRFTVPNFFNATEAGLGTASVLFGATGGKNPKESSIMSMALVFTTQVICFFMFLAFTMSGTWNSGLQQTPLVMATYATVFGSLGEIIANILSILFGVGVLVGYAFVGRECWLFLTRGRWEWIFMVIYSLMAPLGALSDVSFVWSMVRTMNAALLILNVYGLLYLLPVMRKWWKNAEKKPA